MSTDDSARADLAAHVEQVPALRAAELHEPPAPRRYLAPNVIALWHEDRPRVVNPPRRGRLPRGVERLRMWDRLRPGVFAYLWNACLPENRGAVVQLLNRDDAVGPNYWRVRGVSGLLAQAGIQDGARDPVLRAEVNALGANLRRCPAPRGARSALL